MGAAQHQHVGAGLAQLAHRGFYGGAQGGAFQLAALDQGDPLGAGPQRDAHLGRFTLHQGGELAAGQRAGGGEHADHAAGGQVGGGLDGWLHADHDQAGVARAQVGDGRGRGRVAGHHDGFGVALDEVVRDGFCASPHVIRGFSP